MHRDSVVTHDLVQDLFLEVHRSRRSYTPPLPVRPWIFGIARNVFARNRRVAALQPRQSPEPNAENDLAVVPAPGVPFADALEIENAITSLPASSREPWLLHHLFGFSFDWVATRLGITVMAAKLRSSRATRALRLALHATGKPPR